MGLLRYGEAYHAPERGATPVGARGRALPERGTPSRAFRVVRLALRSAQRTALLHGSATLTAERQTPNRPPAGRVFAPHSSGSPTRTRGALSSPSSGTKVMRTPQPE